MASPQTPTPAGTAANAKVSTPIKSSQTEAVPPPPINSLQVNPSPAPTPTSPQASIATVSSSPPIADPLIQHPSSTSQIAKSIPTSVASLNPITQSGSPHSISQPKSTAGTTAKSPVFSTNPDSSSSSDRPSGSSNLIGPVVGSVFAVLALIVVVVGGVWYLQRRKEKLRMRQEAKRMRSSNFGLYESGELIHEKRASIEATLEADLARLRNLDVNIPIIVDDYDATLPPKPSLIHPSQPFPSLQIVSKPSYRVKDSGFKFAPSDTAGPGFISKQTPTKVAYVDYNQAKEYERGYGSPTKEDGLSSSPASTRSVQTPEAKFVFQIDEPAHHHPPAGFFAPARFTIDEGRQKSESMNDFQQWCANQGHLEPSSFDQNCWPQSPSIDSSNREISPLCLAVQSNFDLPLLTTLPPISNSFISMPSPSTLEFMIHNVDFDATRKPITLSVDP